MPLARALLRGAAALAVLAAAAPAPGQDDAVARRARSLLDAQVDAPFPDPDSADPETRAWGRVAFALAAYATGRELERADRALEELLAELPVPLDTSYSFPALFPVPLLWRLYLLPDSPDRMGAGARRAVEESMWRFAFWRSRVDDAGPDVERQVWRIHMSENHDFMQKSSFLLAAQVLKRLPDYRDRPLADGRLPAEHQAAWEQHLIHYLSQRALRGLTAEFASPTYGKYTLHAVYNLAEFAESADLARRATDFVTLFWADVAQDFLAGSGVRGGAKIRTYKNAYATRGTAEALRDCLAMYGWHPDLRARGAHPMTVALASSRYRIPAPVTAVARLDKPPYQYTSRRLGLGTSSGTGDELWYELEPEATRIVRDSFVAPEFALGAMTLDPQLHYTNLNRQNRWMGAMAASHPNARIAVFGHANGTVGWQEIHGVLEGSALVVGRSPGAVNLGTQIFVSHAGDLWARWEEGAPGGWAFTRTGEAFFGVRIAAEPGGPAAQAEAGEDGAFLHLLDPWAPIVIEAGRAADYGSPDDPDEVRFERFKAALADNPFFYDGARLDYLSEQGHRFEFWRASERIPTVDGVERDLEPELVYDSPYLVARAGEDRVTVRSPGLGDLVLPFQACAAGDEDGDAVCGERDNCVEVPNPTQLDSNGDGFGNACDADYDDDGATSGTDFVALLAGLGSSRGEPRFREILDFDGSGRLDGLDFSFLVSQLGRRVGPSGLSCAGRPSCAAP